MLPLIFIQNETRNKREMKRMEKNGKKMEEKDTQVAHSLKQLFSLFSSFRVLEFLDLFCSFFFLHTHQSHITAMTKKAFKKIGIIFSLLVNYI